MARATSGLGQFRGKVGSVVFRVSQGQQIASAYQPAVRNPKSNLQTAQRNKMYLASQLSKLVPREDIVGVAPRGSARDRRGLFLRNILDSAVSTLENGLFTSYVDPASVIFSNGVEMEGVAFGGFNSENSTATITFDTTVITQDVYSRLAIKIVQLDIMNGVYIGYKSSWLELPEYNPSNNTLTATINFTGLAEYGITNLWAIPVLLNDNVRYSRERKTLIQAGMTDSMSNQALIIQGEYAINNAVYEWKKSQFIGGTDGQNPIYPPTEDGDQVVNPDGPSFPDFD